MIATQNLKNVSDNQNNSIELVLLYQFSNTILSAITLNKLTHLILTALITKPERKFERAMLFLFNERSGTLQGMVGVSSKSASLKTVDNPESLTSYWDIDDEIVAQERNSDFAKEIRGSRIDIHHKCPVIDALINQHKTEHFRKDDCLNCSDCTFLNHLGISDFVATPLITNDALIGIIVIDNSNTFSLPISESALQFIRLFANQAGMAIEHSMLHSRIDDAKASLKDVKERLIHGERLASIGEMAASLAHELKNPLITIGGFAARLNKLLPECTPEHHYAETIAKESARLERMLADILAFSKKTTICFSECNLSTVIEDSLDACMTAIDIHSISVDTPLMNEKYIVSGDCYQLKQLFINLILNACDAMPDGGRLSITFDNEHKYDGIVAVELHDSGGGIPEEILNNIFTPFFTTKQHGTGLGLSIVNRIVANHNGKISAHNKDGGAIFRITLPVIQSIES